MTLKTIDINGLQTIYPHPPSSVAEAYDLNGNLLKVSRSTSEIDNFGNSTQSTEKVFNAADKLVRTTTKTIEYKSPDLSRWLFGLPKKTTTSLTDTESSESYTNVATAYFLADGKPDYEILEPNSSKWVKKKYTYDAFGNRKTSTVSAAGVTGDRTTTTTYTSNGRFPLSVTNALGHTITTDFNPLLSKPNSVTDANGITKEFLYDAFGTTIRESKGHQNNNATRGRQIILPKFCVASSNCPANAVYFILAMDNEGGSVESAYYDVNGKELRKQTTGFDEKQIVVETEYDKDGRATRVTQPYFKGVETAKSTRYFYDVLGRQTKRINPANDVFLTGYNGLEVWTQNPGSNDNGNPQISRVFNNIFGQPIESQDPAGNSTSYEYDGRGKLIKTIDSMGNVATIDYDPTFGRKIAMNDPDLGQWTYKYDSLGNLIEQVDAKGQRTEMTYDVLNRLVRRVDDAGGTNPEETKWTFSNSNSAGNVIGGLEKVTSPRFQRTVKYDELSRVSRATSIIDGSDELIQRTGYLGTADKVDWIEYPSGLTVRNTYDDYGFPKTVEGITLDYAKYQEFQAASRSLNDYQRKLEAWKDDHLSDAQLAQLEAHEREVARKGKILSDFYKAFDDDPSKLSYEAAALRYSGDEDKGIDGLLLRVQKKLEQHRNWLNIYQKEFETRYERIKPSIARLDLLPGLIKPHQKEYDRLEPSFNYHNRKMESYQNTVKSWASKVNDYGKRMNAQKKIIDRILPHAKENEKVIKLYIRELFYPHIAHTYINHPEQMSKDLSCCSDYVAKHYIKSHLSEHKITHDFNAIANHSSALDKRSKEMEKAADEIKRLTPKYKHAESEFKHYEWRVRDEFGKADSYARKMKTQADKIEKYGKEQASLLAKINPDTHRMEKWLRPVIESHNNILMSFTDRARAYVKQVSLRMGSYAKRDDLKVEKFLKPFFDHINYLNCLPASSKTSGACYAQNLVHVLKDDGTVDTAKQNTARAKVDPNARVDIKQFYRTNRFFCSYYHGYTCTYVYRTEIMQLAKKLHKSQCAKMTTKEKADSIKNGAWTCDASKWNETYVHSGNGLTYPKYPPLISRAVRTYPAITTITNLGAYKTAITNKHKLKVETLVKAATLNTYNPETAYANIIRPGGGLWQANPWADEPVEEGDSDPKEFVLIYKGSMQVRANNLMSADELYAEKTLKGNQFVVAKIMNAGQANAYRNQYVKVQDQLALVTKLYNEIDQAYADASDDDDFDDNDFNESKKVYWRADDINSKGQILKATYGNGTNTTWSYDQFGRINSHLTKNSVNQTLLNNRYQYDAIGNLTQRADFIEGVTENFDYDDLNRLVQVNMSGSGTDFVKQVNGEVINYDYDELGNLIHKSDIKGGGSNGNYTYGQNSAGPHAVTFISGIGGFTYDNNGNQLTGNGRVTQYSAFNKPIDIIKKGKRTSMLYGPERQMIKQVEHNTPRGVESTVYVGGLFEQITTQGKGVVNRHNIAVAGSVIAVVETKPDSLVTTKEHYLHKNHQSSVLSITDVTGKQVERRYYDAFGQVKSYIGQASKMYASGIGYEVATDLSFTSHKWLQSAEVVHMRGRVYDPFIGRFMSADPHIQSPLNSQSLNRYSYVHNNPLSWTDPSGYFLKSIFKALKKLFEKIAGIIKKIAKVIQKVAKSIGKLIKKKFQLIKKYYKVVIAVVVIVVVAYFSGGSASGIISQAWSWAVTGAKIGAVTGGLSGLIQTGSLRGMIEGAFHGAVSGFKAGFISGLVGIGPVKGGNIFANAARVGLSNGVVNKIQGYSFSAGFKIGALSYLAFNALQKGAAFFKRQFVKPTITLEQTQLANMSAAAYDGDFTRDFGGYQNIGGVVRESSGLQYAHFVNNGQHVIAFAGTNGGSDWWDNILQGLGFGSKQYTRAMEIGSSMGGHFGSENVSFTGQSLGGGLAAAAAVSAGANATVFNAARVHANTLRGYDVSQTTVTSFRSTFDVLTVANLIVPSSVNYSPVSLGPGAGWHPLSGICRVVNCKP